MKDGRVVCFGGCERTGKRADRQMANRILHLCTPMACERGQRERQSGRTRGGGGTTPFPRGMPSSAVHLYLSHGEMKGRGPGDVLKKRSGASGAALTDEQRSRFPVFHDGRLSCMERRARGIPQPPPVGPDHLHLQSIRRTELSESPFKALGHQCGQHVGLLVRHRAHADARSGGAWNDRGVVAGRLMNRKGETTFHHIRRLYCRRR